MSDTPNNTITFREDIDKGFVKATYYSMDGESGSTVDFVVVHVPSIQVAWLDGSHLRIQLGCGFEWHLTFVEDKWAERALEYIVYCLEETDE